METFNISSQEEDALLGSRVGITPSESRNIFSAIDGLNGTMEAVASNIQKIGEVWATMAAEKKPAKRYATVFEEGEEGDDSSCSDIDGPMDHQDEDDVASLLNAAGKQPKAAKCDS